MATLDSYTPGGRVVIRVLRNYRGRNHDCGSVFSLNKRWEKYADKAVRKAQAARRLQDRQRNRLERAIVRDAGRRAGEELSPCVVHIALSVMKKSFTSSKSARQVLDMVTGRRKRKWMRMHPIRLRLKSKHPWGARRCSMQSSFSVFDHSGSSVTFSLQGGSDDAKGNRSSYAAATLSTAGAPVLLKFENQVKPIGSEGSDKHRAMVQYVVRDAQNRPHVFSATLVWSIPRLPASMNPETIATDTLWFLMQAAGKVGSLSGGPIVAPSDGVVTMKDNLLP